MKKVVYWIRYRYLQTFFIYLSVIGISATLCTLWMTTWRVAPLSCELLQAHVQSPSDWTIPTGSLIPRSFPPPVFDSKYRGEGLGDLITLDRQMVDTQGASVQRSMLKPFLVVSVQGLKARAFTRQQQWRMGQHEMGTITVGNCPPPHAFPSVYLTSPHMTRSPRPSIHICILQILEVGMAWKGG